jgi:hypothetical protein
MEMTMIQRSRSGSRRRAARRRLDDAWLDVRTARMLTRFVWRLWTVRPARRR